MSSIRLIDVNLQAMRFDIGMEPQCRWSFVETLPFVVLTKAYPIRFAQFYRPTNVCNSPLYSTSNISCFIKDHIDISTLRVIETRVLEIHYG